MRAMNTGKKANSNILTVPAPIGGLNARDSLASMPATDAVILDNVFSDSTSVFLRSGCKRHASNMPSAVETLLAYNSPTNSKLFAFSGGKIFNVSTGTNTLALVSGLSNSLWQSVNFSNVGGHYLIAVNGLDDLRIYNGTSWSVINGTSTPAITGIDTNKFTDVNIFKQRLWFIEKESFKAWYLPVLSIGGTALSLDLGSLFKLGGKLLCMMTISIGNTADIDDYAAFLSTEGEVALYKGIDPNDADNWALVGMYRIARPIGQRCYTKYGADTIVLTTDGLIQLSATLLTDRQQINSISDKIRSLIAQNIKLFPSGEWSTIFYPTGRKVIVNAPQEGNKAYQYVMNSTTGAWMRFTGWNALCWCVFNDKLYFGGDKFVNQAETGTSDNGVAINMDILPAFNYFGSQNQKRFKMVRPVFSITSEANLKIGICADFEKNYPTNIIKAQGNSSPWNTSPWNTSSWSDSVVVKKEWQHASGIGFCASLRMICQTKEAMIELFSIDYAFEAGGIL